jgi:hypothetical protein
MYAVVVLVGLAMAYERPLKSLTHSRLPTEGMTYRAALAAGQGTLVHVEGGALTPNMPAMGGRRDALFLLLALERQRLESLQPSHALAAGGSKDSGNVLEAVCR